MNKIEKENKIKNKEVKNAYQDILKTCEKYAQLKDKYGCDFDDIGDMATSARNHLTLVEWLEKYGLELSHEYKPHSCNHFVINEHMFFSYYRDAKKENEAGNGKYISWSDSGKQPFNEWLCCTSFSTGAYIFGDDYDSQKKLFQDFFNELKSYNPDFSDSHNSNLYWRLENAKGIFNDFNDIIKKYRDRNGKELKQREITKLEMKLKTLKESK
jgi:hypothetical protein